MIDRSLLAEDLIEEGKKCCLRLIREQDRNDYIEVNRENSIMSGAYRIPEFIDSLWKYACNDDVTFAVIENSSARFVEYINLQNVENEEPEIGISILKEYQGMGIGTEAMGLLMKILRETFGATQTYVARVDARCGEMGRDIAGDRVRN